MAAVALAASAGVSASSLIQNGSFETATFDPGGFATLSAGDTRLTGWTIGGVSIDYIGTYWQASDGDRSLDMSGLGAGSVSQMVALTANQSYLLSFDMAGNPDNAPVVKSLEVKISNGTDFAQTFTFDTTGQTKSAMGWVTYGINFVAASPTDYTFTFTSLDSEPYGPALDNVSLTAVPLPPAAILFGSAIVGVSLLGRRRLLVKKDRDMALGA